MTMHDDDEPLLPKDDCHSWHEFMTTFDRDVWSKLKRYGFSRDTILIVWTLNKVNNELIRVGESLEDGEDRNG